MTITVMESQSFGERAVRVFELPALTENAIADVLRTSPHRNMLEGAEFDSLATEIADALVQCGCATTRWGAYEVVDIAPRPGRLEGRAVRSDDCEHSRNRSQSDTTDSADRANCGITLTETLHFADRLVRVIELPSLTEVAVAAMLYDSPRRAIRGKIGASGLVKRIVEGLAHHGRAEMDWGDYQLVTIKAAQWL
ncbi:hypothetical protein [Rhodococcus qingshengii]|uniref:hypothetical protein n=1 Tax=Rhodococcus qingshengii TaxID=334542 RepID=UPI001A5A7133|nr:hypothetical protein [Rhodococcus qingshengii]ULD38839.1 hypothetical protein JKI97_00625 [Rhodococcus qingshengii]